MKQIVMARSRVFALVGDPVAHSFSPVIQNAAMQGTGMDGVYVAVRAGADEMVALVRGLARAGGGGNITLPHKEKAATVVEVPSAAVRKTVQRRTQGRSSRAGQARKNVTPKYAV